MTNDMNRAFARDPLFLHLFGNSELDQKAKNSVTAFVSFMFDKSFFCNHAFYSIRISGKTLNLLNSYMRITRSVAPSLTHHYLIMIGVKPEVHGKGIGTALLLHLLNMVNEDDTSQGVALATENKENIYLYRKFGVIVSRETQINNVPVYCMFYQKD
jgi:ribosomal protein S18 acetylase RimI-like enzyme